MSELCGVCGAYWECSCVNDALEGATVIIEPDTFIEGDPWDRNDPLDGTMLYGVPVHVDQVDNLSYVESWADTLTDADYANAIVAQYDSTLDFTLDLLTGEANT